MKKNILAQLINEEKKVKPYFFGTETWKYVKAILDEIKFILCDKFFDYETINTAETFIEIHMNSIAETAEDVNQLYEVHRYTEELIYYYIEYGIQEECYESVSNLQKLQEIIISRFHLI